MARAPAAAAAKPGTQLAAYRVWDVPTRLFHWINALGVIALAVIGFLILLYVVINADIAAQTLGFLWLGIGVIVLITFYLTGRRPELAGLAEGSKP